MTTTAMGSRITDVLSPDYYYRSIHNIDFAELKARGIDTLLVDLDNTLLARNSAHVTAEARRWAEDAARQGMRVCIVSNNWHDRVLGVAELIGVPIVAKALKPFPHAFRRALALMGIKRSQAAVVGDQMFTDVLGGKLLGIVTILVVPLSTSDLPHTRLLRRIERGLLAERRPLP